MVCQKDKDPILLCLLFRDLFWPFDAVHNACCKLFSLYLLSHKHERIKRGSQADPARHSGSRERNTANQISEVADQVRVLLYSPRHIDAFECVQVRVTFVECRTRT